MSKVPGWRDNYNRIASGLDAVEQVGYRISFFIAACPSLGCVSQFNIRRGYQGNPTFSQPRTRRRRRWRRGARRERASLAALERRNERERGRERERIFLRASFFLHSTHIRASRRRSMNGASESPLPWRPGGEGGQRGRLPVVGSRSGVER